MTTATTRRHATFEELRALRPAKTSAQVAALRAADFAMDEQYAGNFVAYIDTWKGDELERSVVVAEADPSEFQRLLTALSTDVRRGVQLTLIPPADTVSATSASASD